MVDRDSYLRRVLKMSMGDDSPGGYDSQLASAQDSTSKLPDIGSLSSCDTDSYKGRITQALKQNPQRQGQTNMAGRKVGNVRIWQ